MKTGGETRCGHSEREKDSRGKEETPGKGVWEGCVGMSDESREVKGRTVVSPQWVCTDEVHEVSLLPQPARDKIKGQGSDKHVWLRQCLVTRVEKGCSRRVLVSTSLCCFSVVGVRGGSISLMAPNHEDPSSWPDHLQIPQLSVQVLMNLKDTDIQQHMDLWSPGPVGSCHSVIAPVSSSAPWLSRQTAHLRGGPYYRHRALSPIPAYACPVAVSKVLKLQRASYTLAPASGLGLLSQAPRRTPAVSVKHLTTQTSLDVKVYTTLFEKCTPMQAVNYRKLCPLGLTTCRYQGFSSMASCKE